MRSGYGAAILADSQETVRDDNGYEFKYSVLKIIPETVAGFQYIIAGSGNGHGIDELCEQFGRVLAQRKPHSINAFRGILELEIGKQLKHLRDNNPDDPLIEVIVAVVHKGIGRYGGT
jgi:hypothetical protein